MSIIDDVTKLQLMALAQMELNWNKTVFYFSRRTLEIKH